MKTKFIFIFLLFLSIKSLFGQSANVDITSILYNFLLSKYYFYNISLENRNIEDINAQLDSLFAISLREEKMQICDYYQKQKKLLNTFIQYSKIFETQIDTSFEKSSQYLDFYYKTLFDFQQNYLKIIDYENEQAKQLNYKVLEINNLFFYYNEVLKIYLEKYFLEKDLIVAIDNHDTASILQRKEHLILSLSAVGSKLQIIELYKNDPILKFACQKSFNSMLAIIKSQIPPILENYRIEAQIFEELSKITSIPKNKRNKEQKKKIEELTNSQKNKKEELSIKEEIFKKSIIKNQQDWQELSKKFFEKYLPK